MDGEIPVDIWHLMQAARGQMFAARRKVHASPPPVQELVQEFGLAQSIMFIGSLTYMLTNYDRTALSTEHYRIRNVYDNPVVIERQLAGFAADGLLQKDGDTYHLTDKGLQVYERMLVLIRPRWELPHGMGAEIERIIALMQRVIAATAEAPVPPARWSFDTRRQKGIAQPEIMARLERFDWHIFDLWAYRDDVHLAAWSGYSITPFAWEAFTLLWNGQWDTIAKLAEVQTYREFSADEWAECVSEIVRPGWAASVDGIYTLTETGQSVRDAAEQTTDAYFYAPWSCLTAAEIEELRGLLTRLRDKFSALATA